MRELKETVELMNSSDYRDRFRAEYEQLSIRYDKLETMVAKYKNGLLDFTPACSIDLLLRQLKAMANYLVCLRERAEIEGIEL